jgi:DNA-binding XRE family transcriptional regulator
MTFDYTTDAAVLAELGRRLERHRLERNWTQAVLAAEAGVGQATVQRAERGESVQMTSMIKLLRALGLLAALDVAIPESIDLPIAQLESGQSPMSSHGGGARSRVRPYDRCGGDVMGNQGGSGFRQSRCSLRDVPV